MDYDLCIRVDSKGRVFLKNEGGKNLNCHMVIEGYGDTFENLPTIYAGQEVEVLRVPTLNPGSWRPTQG